MTKRTVFLLFLLILVIAVYWTSSIRSQLSNVLDASIIDDQADIFPPESENYLASYHEMLLDKFEIDYHVLTINKKIDIDTFAAQQFAQRKVGNNSPSYRGLLLVINTAADEIRMEVSGSLESVFTDAFVSYVERRQMVPFFNENRVGDGVFATGEIIRIRALEAQQGQEFDESQFIGSIGGGAKTEAGIGKGRQPLHNTEQANVFAANTPEEAFKRLINAYRQHIDRRDLDILTESSRQHMAGMIVTMAQMDNVYKRYKNCEIERVTHSDDHKRAVILFKLADRACDPFLFEKGTDNKWRIDLKTAGIGLGHTYGNIWYIHYGRYQESGIWQYMFGFKDLYFRRPKGEQFDHQGIPYYNSWGVKFNYVRDGSVITRIEKGGFIDKLGLKLGDLIVAWEGYAAPSPDLLGRRMKNVRTGLDVEIVYFRQGQKHRLVTQAPPKASGDNYRWGVTVSRTGPTYPMVNYVSPNSQADKMGLMEGDAVISWQNQELPLIHDILKKIHSTTPGDKVSAIVLRGEQAIALTHTAEPLRKMSKVH